MNSVKVKKADLLAKLEANHKAHRDLVVKAWEGYRIKSVELLDQALERARKGSRENVCVVLEMPQDHSKDYERVIEMLRMSVDDEIVLEEHDFSTYVLDRWEWSARATASNTAYASAVR